MTVFHPGSTIAPYFFFDDAGNFVSVNGNRSLDVAWDTFANNTIFLPHK